MMKQFTVTIPDDEESGFIEMMKSISYIESIEENTAFDIPEEHKLIVRDRIEKYENSPESYLSWEDMEDNIKLE